MKSIKIISLFAVLLLISCSKNTQKMADSYQTKEKTNLPQIGFSIATNTIIIERWNKDIRIFDREIRSQGGEPILQISAGGTDSQITQISFLLNQGIDALVVVPDDSDLISGIIRQVKEKDIPVIAYDRMINNAPIDAYISFDNEKVGSLMAEALVKNAPFGNYLIINGPVKDNNTYYLNKGIHNVLARHVDMGSIKIKSEIWLDDWSSDEAKTKVEEIFNQSENYVGIIAANDQIADAAIQVLSERRLTGKVLVVGQDADLLSCQRIVEGIQLMTVYKPINKLATTAANISMEIINNKLSMPNLYIDNGSGKEIPFYREEPIAVFAYNMKDTIIKDGFHSMNDVYLSSKKK